MQFTHRRHPAAVVGKECAHPCRASMWQMVSRHGTRLAHNPAATGRAKSRGLQKMRRVHYCERGPRSTEEATRVDTGDERTEWKTVSERQSTPRDEKGKLDTTGRRECDKEASEGHSVWCQAARGQLKAGRGSPLAIANPSTNLLQQHVGSGEKLQLSRAKR